MSNVTVPGFVFARPEDARQTQSVTKVAAMETLIVEYKDADGKAKTCLAFRHQQSGTTFLLQEKINGVFVATSANKWFCDSLTKHIKSTGMDVKGENPSKDEGLAQV